MTNVMVGKPWIRLHISSISSCYDVYVLSNTSTIWRMWNGAFQESLAKVVREYHKNVGYIFSNL